MTAPASPYVDPRGWVLVDRLLVAYFTARVALGDAAFVTWRTALVAEDQAPMGRVMRLPGGGINRDGFQDLSRIEITTFGRTRPESDDMTAQVRQLMADLDCDEYADIGIDTVREDLGPGRVPDVNEDVRAVPTVWSVTARKPYHLISQ